MEKEERDEPKEDSLLVARRNYQEICLKLMKKGYNRSPKKSLFARAEPRKVPLRPSMVDRACCSTSVVSSTPMPHGKKKNFTPESSGSMSPINDLSAVQQKKTEQSFANLERLHLSQEPSVITISSQAGSTEHRKSSPLKKISHRDETQHGKGSPLKKNSHRDETQQQKELTRSQAQRLEKIISTLVRYVDPELKAQTSRNNSARTPQEFVKKLGRNVFSKSVKARQTQTGASLEKNSVCPPSDSSGSSSITSDTDKVFRVCDGKKLSLNSFSCKMPSAEERKKILSIDTGVPWRAPSGIQEHIGPTADSLVPMADSMEEDTIDESFLPKLPKQKKVFTNKKKLQKNKSKTPKKKEVEEKSPKKQKNAKMKQQHDSRLLEDNDIDEVSKRKKKNEVLNGLTRDPCDFALPEGVDRKKSVKEKSKSSKKRKDDEVETLHGSVTRQSLRQTRARSKNKTQEMSRDVPDVVEQDYQDANHTVEPAHISVRRVSPRRKQGTSKHKTQDVATDMSRNDLHVAEQHYQDSNHAVEIGQISFRRTSPRRKQDISKNKIQLKLTFDDATDMLEDVLDAVEHCQDTNHTIEPAHIPVKRTSLRLKQGNSKNKIQDVSQDALEQHHQDLNPTVEVTRLSVSPKSTQRHSKNKTQDTSQFTQDDLPQNPEDVTFGGVQNKSKSQDSIELSRRILRNKTSEAKNKNTETVLKTPPGKVVTPKNKQKQSKKKPDTEKVFKSPLLEKFIKPKTPKGKPKRQKKKAQDLLNATNQETQDAIPNTSKSVGKKKEVAKRKASPRKVPMPQALSDDSHLYNDGGPDSRQLNTKKTSPKKKKMAAERSTMSSQEDDSVNTVRRSGRSRKPAQRPCPNPLICHTRREYDNFTKKVAPKGGGICYSTFSDNSKINNSNSRKISTIKTGSSVSTVSPIQEVENEEEHYNDNVQMASTSKEPTLTSSKAISNKVKPKANSVISGRIKKKASPKTKKKIVESLRRTMNESQDDEINNILNIYEGGTLKTLRWAFHNPQYKSVKGMPGVQTAIVEGVATGLLKINKGMNKPKQIAQNNQLSFSILDGKAEVGVQDKSGIFTKHESFIVPAGGEYYIRNLETTKDLVLVFTKFPKSP